MHKSGSEDGSDRQSPTVAGNQNACWNCGRKANETCSGCNLARYCGSFCQHKDWEQHHQVNNNNFNNNKMNEMKHSIANYKCCMNSRSVEIRDLMQIL